MKQKIINFLQDFDEFKEIQIENLIQIPKNKDLADYTFPTFILSKKLNKNPNEISLEISKKLNNKKEEFLEKIQNEGPYINFFLDKKNLFLDILKDFKNKKFFNFSNLEKNPQKILLEWPSPNTNKALHIGHSRNMILGKFLSNIYEKFENKLIRVNLNNDRGISICKTIVMYEEYCDGKTPKDLNLKPDLFIQKFYEMFEKKNKEFPEKEYEKIALKYLEKWEEGDKKIIKFWKEILNFVYQGYEITYKNYKIPKYDKNYFESEIYNKGREIVIDAFNKKCNGFYKEEDGAIGVDFKDKTLGKKILLRQNGTTLYMTQDIYLNELKEKEFNPDKSIFVVGCEQEYHFKVLFEILKRIGNNETHKNIHYSYGYVYDKNGKKFSSRNGDVILADEILDIVQEKAKNELLKREFSKNLEENILENRSQKIGFAAIVFSFLKVDPKNDIKFDIEKSLSFDGETSSYILYTFARINSILRKVNFDFEKENLKELDFQIGEIEKKIILEIFKYRGSVFESYQKLKANILCNYLLNLCQKFNFYYNSNKIIGSENEKFKLVMIYLISKIIEDGCETLGFEVIDEM